MDSLAPAPINNDFAPKVVPEKVWIRWFTDVWAWIKKLPYSYNSDWAGVATLVAGTVTVLNTNVNASTYIQLNPQTAGNEGFLSISIINGKSFTITSTNALDVRVIFYQIFKSL